MKFGMKGDIVMTCWTEKQKYRLALEKKVIEEEFPHFTFCHRYGFLCVEGRQSSSFLMDEYRLTLIIPSYFPDEEPKMYVTDPITLWKYGYAGTVNEKPMSHAFHTDINGPDGCVQICLGDWNPSLSLNHPILQGLLWLRAYDKHLKTGKTINKILKQWKERLESW